ncbi:hypothetical protein ACWDSJ_16930 [Nocardia sp. NPDC003482]
MNNTSEMAVAQHLSCDAIHEGSRKPKAVGLLRHDISVGRASEHADAIRHHAELLGYHYLYTVRPPEATTDPIAYALEITRGANAAALVVHDLAEVDYTPSRVTGVCDLETVDPPVTWAAARPGIVDPGHALPDHDLTVEEAQRIWQDHRACRAVWCPRKAAAFEALVRAGKVVPPLRSSRQRAAERGIAFPAAEPDGTAVGPDMQTLLEALDGLASAEFASDFGIRPRG